MSGSTDDSICIYSQPEDAAAVVAARCIMLNAKKNTLYTSVRWLDEDCTVIGVRMIGLPSQRRAKEAIIRAVMADPTLDVVFGGINRVAVASDLITVYFKSGKRNPLIYSALMFEDPTGMQFLEGLSRMHMMLTVNPEEVAHFCAYRHKGNVLDITVLDLPSGWAAQRKLEFWLKKHLCLDGSASVMVRPIKNIAVSAADNKITFYFV